MKFLSVIGDKLNSKFLYLRSGPEGHSVENSPHNFPKLDVTPRQRAQLPWTTFYRYSQLKQQVAQTASAGSENIYHSTRKRAFDQMRGQMTADFNRIKNHPLHAGLPQGATRDEVREVYYDVTVPAEDRSRAIDYLTLMRRQAASQVGVIDVNWNRRAGDDHRESQFITHGARERFSGTMTLGQFALLLAEKEGINLPQHYVQVLLSDTKQRSAAELFRYRYEKISGKTLARVDKFNVDYISTYYSQLGRENQVIMAIARDLEAQSQRSSLNRLAAEVGNRQVTFLEFAEFMAQSSGQVLDPQTQMMLAAVRGGGTINGFQTSLQRRLPEFSYTNVIMFLRDFCGKKEVTVAEYLESAVEQGRVGSVSSSQLQTLGKAQMKYPVSRLVSEEQKRGTQPMLAFVVNNITRFDNIS